VGGGGVTTVYRIRINSRTYTVPSDSTDILEAVSKAVELFEADTGRDFDPCRDRFEGAMNTDDTKPEAKP
jgi:hypothetical protein